MSSSGETSPQPPSPQLHLDDDMEDTGRSGVAFGISEQRTERSPSTMGTEMTSTVNTTNDRSPLTKEDDNSVIEEILKVAKEDDGVIEELLNVARSRSLARRRNPSAAAAGASRSLTASDLDGGEAADRLTSMRDFSAPRHSRREKDARKSKATNMIRASTVKDDKTLMDEVAGFASIGDEFDDEWQKDEDGKESRASQTSGAALPLTTLKNKTTIELLNAVDLSGSLNTLGFDSPTNQQVLLNAMNKYNAGRSAKPRGRHFGDDAFVDMESMRNTNVSWTQIDDVISRVIEVEFPKEGAPTARRVINVGKLYENKARYRPGSWVEIRGLDMKWRLAMITRVIKQAPDDWDWNNAKASGKEPEWTFYYHAGMERRLEEDELRSPEEGLHRLFGRRPWVWQQYACIKVEDKLRFQKGHQNDHMIFDVQKYVAELWEEWLDHPSNSDFKAVFDDDRVGDFGRSELVNHIMKPFKLLGQIKEDRDTWDFEGDDSIGVFTYVGILGSGYITAFTLMFLQVAIPLLLAMAVDGCPLISQDVLYFNACSDEQREDEDIDLETYRKGVYHAMSIVVFIMYFVRVVPDTLLTFYNIMGGYNTTYSRLTSLRQLLWSHDGDSFGQMVGYKLEIFMNTAYVSLLYMLNIYIILYSDSVLDIILNSLAFEFVTRLDEDLTKTLWWDHEQRWITAGAMSLVLQSTTQRNWLKNPKLFSDQYLIPEDRLHAACNDPHLLCNERVASDDMNNVTFMSKDEEIKFRFRKVAHVVRNKNAVNEYEKPTVYFGWMGKCLRTLLFQKDKSTFNRFSNYRTWSRWGKVLYMSPVPCLDNLFITIGGEKAKLADNLEGIAPPRTEFANFDPDDKDGDFIQHVVDVLLLRNMYQSVTKAWGEKSWLRFLVRLFDGFVEWGVYIITGSFPIVVIAAIIAVARSDIMMGRVMEVVDNYNVYF